jgi:hypothetical protein
VLDLASGDRASDDRGEPDWIVRTVNYIPYDPLHPARTTTMEHLWSELKAWLDERS